MNHLHCFSNLCIWQKENNILQITVNVVLTQLNLFFLYSWALLHLTMVKLVLHNVKNFFPIAGLEFTGMLNCILHFSFLYK